MQQISIAIRNFNDRVKQMNQTNSRQLTLSAEEARNLHSDIYGLLNNVTELVTMTQPAEAPKSNQLNLDGGGF
jgi:hypothetical protein